MRNFLTYMNGNKNNELVAKDERNLISLAKQIAVLKYFHQEKQ